MERGASGNEGLADNAAEEAFFANKEAKSTMGIQSEKAGELAAELAKMRKQHKEGMEIVSDDDESDEEKKMAA